MCDKSTKNVGASEMPPHPSTSEGGALREPRAKQSNGFLAYALPSAARRRTPARYCTRCLAYAPAIKRPARYRAGRARQYHPARNTTPPPPSGESGAGSARSLVRPSFLCCSSYTTPGLFPLLFHLLPGQEGGEGGHLPVPLAFFASFWQKKEEKPSFYALLPEQTLWLAFALALSQNFTLGLSLFPAFNSPKSNAVHPHRQTLPSPAAAPA